MDMDYLASLLDEIYQLIHSYLGSWGIRFALFFILVSFIFSLLKRFASCGGSLDFSVSDLLSTSDDDGFSIFDDQNADLYTMDDSGIIHAIYTYHGGDDDC